MGRTSVLEYFLPAVEVQSESRPSPGGAAVRSCTRSSRASSHVASTTFFGTTAPGYHAGTAGGRHGVEIGAVGTRLPVAVGKISNCSHGGKTAPTG